MAVADLQLPGYDIESVLGGFDGRIMYRARRLTDDVEVMVETIDAEYPDRQQIARINREGVIAQCLYEVDGVHKVNEVLPHGNGNMALVGELFESSLRSRLVHSGADGLPLAEVLATVEQLARALDGIHAQGFVHKALAPENVLLDPVSGSIALAGFGIASELDQERQALQISRRIEGPLPYISPEQTGRMNRDLDFRSDYYSLGVLMFELLTGRQLFQADTLLEWVYSHISRVPPAPHEVAAQVPEAVSAIVIKLLAKSPEKRYQSASGLLYDLEDCSALHAAGHEIIPFEAGQKDAVQKFLVPQRLYGREREIEELLGLFEEAAAGRTQFCLVHGYSGAGKTALVNELDRHLVREQGFLIQGKFDQFQHGEAYTALASAFRSLVHQVLAEPEDRLQQWRQRLLNALTPNARLVVDLVPDLELVIGEQPEAAELQPAESRNRLHMLLAAFLRVFAGEGHPVVLFLDDLQWCDAPTLELLRRLVTSRDMSHLLLIGAYRSNEVGAGHPLRHLIDDLHVKKFIRHIPIGPLERNAVAQLVADALSRSTDDTRPLSDMLYDKAQGNPFFTTELLRQLHRDAVIIQDTESGHWNWDLDAARWSGVSHDVVEFMVDNLRQMSMETQQVLQLAACIGNTFDLHTLATIYEHTVPETARALLPALKQHTVLPLHSGYRLMVESNEPLDINPHYRFQHDRVQQAAYALIESGRLPEVHFSVGHLLLQEAGDEVPDDRLIDIVGHLNEGRSLIRSDEERLQLASLNLRAGVRAKRSATYEEALEYLRIALGLLPVNPWQEIPALMQPLATEIQQCAYLTGRVDEAEHWIEVMLEYAQTDLARSDILATRTRQYATLGRMEESIRSAIQGLALLGVQFSVNPDDADVTEERTLVVENLSGRRIADLVDAPLLEDAAVLTAMRLMMEIFPATFLSGSGNLFPYLVLKAVNLSLRHGNCPESAFAYAAYGMLLCGVLDEPATGDEYGKVGLAINDRFDDLTLRARVIYVSAMFVHHWSNHWSSLTPLFRKGIEAGYQSGDLLYLAYSAQDCVIWDPKLDLETAHRLHTENLEIVRECAYQDSLDSATLFLQLQRNMLGLTDSPLSLSDDGFDQEKCLAGMRQRHFMTGIANYNIYQAEVCLLYGEYDRAMEYLRDRDALIRSAMSLPQLVRFYIIMFLTQAYHYPDMEALDQAVVREQMQHDFGRMKRWADHCEENFRHLQYLMEAELVRLDGAREGALEHYDASIALAQQSGFLRDEAMACELAARHLLALGRRRAAEGYLRSAHHLYDRWGARRKVKLLEQEFAVLREMATRRRMLTETSESDDLDVASVMKASRDISGEIVLDRLLKTAMNILLENAGGQWGCLVFRREDRLEVEAGEFPIQGQPVDGVPAQSLVADTTGGQVPLPVTLIRQVLVSGKAVVLGDAAHEGQFMQDPYVLKFTPASVLCAPIRQERFEAVVYMENNLSTGVFTEERARVIRLLAAQASVAIENARLYEQIQDYSRTLEDKVAERTAQLDRFNKELQDLADRDVLTGVANRRRGDVYLEESWSRLRRERKLLSVIMLDIDHFKAYNDNYGHQAGDDCLAAVARALQDQLQRPEDMLARYGGEEFMVILPNTDVDGVAMVAEKLRHAVEALAIEHAHPSAGSVVTMSLGTATTLPASDKGGESLLREADVSLYRAKSMGRNQVYTSPVVQFGAGYGSSMNGSGGMTSN